MSEVATNYTELERNNRISEEFQRISIYFENLPENKKSVVIPLIQNAAFMRVTLDDLQEIIAEQGPVEEYKNGENQFGMKQSAALQSYNALIKNYGATVKTLFGLLPTEKKKPVPSFETWQPREKTEEEREEERRRDEEHRKRINEEIARAAELQRKQWEKEGRIKK